VQRVLPNVSKNNSKLEQPEGPSTQPLKKRQYNKTRHGRSDFRTLPALPDSHTGTSRLLRLRDSTAASVTMFSAARSSFVAVTDVSEVLTACIIDLTTEAYYRAPTSQKTSHLQYSPSVMCCLLRYTFVQRPDPTTHHDFQVLYARVQSISNQLPCMQAVQYTFRHLLTLARVLYCTESFPNDAIP
jgi:hypothetical protein